MTRSVFPSHRPRSARRGAILVLGVAAAVALFVTGVLHYRGRPALPGAAESPPGAPSLPIAGAPRWIVDPRDPGPNLPPVGRSLFDFLTASLDPGRHEVPFPFSALIVAIEEQLAANPPEARLRHVLIPRGRSLQRDAAAPEFFRYPRAVVAVGAEPAVRTARSGMMLKDRLYLGYHEKAAVLEVISYNEAAGRFEFQVVKDYRPGGARRVFHANRSLCMACHQNGGPIFARPLWDETNANPGIASLLRERQRGFYGIPVEQGVDVPYEVDNATDRANRFAAYQLIWREGCGPDASPTSIACRADLFALALQFRLSGGRSLDRRSPRYRRSLSTHLLQRWRDRWPGGLLVPSPDIPNRIPLSEGPALPASVRIEARMDPVARDRLAELVRTTDVPSAFEPLNPREPLETWTTTDAAGGLQERLLGGLSEFLAEADIRRLDEHLSAAGALPALPPSRFTSLCEMSSTPREASVLRLSFACRGPGAGSGEGGFAMEGRIYVKDALVLRGSIDGVTIDGLEEVPGLEVQGGGLAFDGRDWQAALRVVQRASRLHARRANGQLVQDLRLRWPGKAAAATPSGRATRELQARAELQTLDDFSRVERAIDDMARHTAGGELDALADQPFRRARLMEALEARLGMAPLEWCCLHYEGMPPPALDEPPDHRKGDRSPDERIRAFHHYCGRCHETADRFPPNFLHGTPAAVEASIARCSERIFFRLGMWGLGDTGRPKTPMPPVSALAALDVTREGWPAHRDLRLLQDYVGGVLRAQTGRAPRLEDLSARGYPNLRSCLDESQVGRTAPGR